MVEAAERAEESQKIDSFPELPSSARQAMTRSPRPYGVLAAVAGTARPRRSRSPSAARAPERGDAQRARLDQLPTALSVPRRLPSSARTPSCSGSGPAACVRIPWSVLARSTRSSRTSARTWGRDSAGAIGWMQFLPSTWLRWGSTPRRRGRRPVESRHAVFARPRATSPRGRTTDLRPARSSPTTTRSVRRRGLELRPTGPLRPRGLGLRPRPRSAEGRGGRRDSRRRAGACRSCDFAIGPGRPPGAALASADRAVCLRTDAPPGSAQCSSRAQRDLLDGPRASSRRGHRCSGALTEAQALGRGGVRDGRRRAARAARGRRQLRVSSPAAPGSSRSRTAHHDYPARTSPPAGSPVFALTAALVEERLAQPLRKLRIGLTMRAETASCGRTAPELPRPARSTGLVPVRGSAVGLVGLDGALDPPTHCSPAPAASAYPQQQPWFEALAGGLRLAGRVRGTVPEPCPHAPVSRPRGRDDWRGRFNPLSGSACRWLAAHPDTAGRSQG